MSCVKIYLSQNVQNCSKIGICCSVGFQLSDKYKLKMKHTWNVKISNQLLIENSYEHNM